MQNHPDSIQVFLITQSVKVAVTDVAPCMSLTSVSVAGFKLAPTALMTDVECGKVLVKT
jgi:hypothetical protein